MPYRHSAVFAEDSGDEMDSLPSMTTTHLVAPTSTQTITGLQSRRRSSSTLKARVSFSQPKDSQEVPLKSDYQAAEVRSSIHRTIHDFVPLRLIGMGCFGEVHLVQDLHTRRLFAKKTIKKAKLSIDHHVLKTQRNERDILARISHPSIVKLFFTFHDKEDINFILDFIPGGELFNHMTLQPGKCINEKYAAFYLSQIADALHHLHTLGIVYRDLKPENCLLDSQGHIILTDFGLSSTDEKCHSLLGTPEFTAPEVLMGEEYSYQADWWSFGVMMFDLIAGKTPYYGRNMKEIQTKIMKKTKIPYEQYHFSSYAVELLQRLLNKNPNKRFQADDKFDTFKKYGFFKEINWKDLRSNTPPIVPQITDPALCENFDLEEMQRMKEEADLSLKRDQQKLMEREAHGIAIPTTTKSHGDIDDSLFKGFSFTAPQSFLEKHMY